MYVLLCIWYVRVGESCVCAVCTSGVYVHAHVCVVSVCVFCGICMCMMCKVCVYVYFVCSMCIEIYVYAWSVHM